MWPVGTDEEYLSPYEKESVNELMESIHNSKLRKLNISDNQFAESTLKVLLQSLPRDTVQKIYLRRVGLDASHLSYLCALVEETQSTLKMLHVSGNSLGSVALGSLFSSVAKTSSLVDLDVSE